MADGTGSGTQTAQGNGDAAALAAAAVAGTPAGGNGSEGGKNGSAADGAANPFSGLDTGTQEWLGKKGVKDVASLAKTAFNAESLLGKSVQLPGEGATKEELDKFFNRLGRPEKAEGYDFKLPDGLPKELPYDGEFAKEFKSWAHEAGLTPRQAALVHDKFVSRTGSFFTKQREAEEARAVSVTDTLAKEWGDPGGDPFKANVEDMTRAVKGLNLEGALKEAGLLGSIEGQGSYVRNADIAKALAKIGKEMFREDNLVGGVSGGVANNPFKDGPGKGNLTEQMAAIRKDKAAAIRAIRAAGHDPKGWNLTE